MTIKSIDDLAVRRITGTQLPVSENTHKHSVKLHFGPKQNFLQFEAHTKKSFSNHIRDISKSNQAKPGGLIFTRSVEETERNERPSSQLQSVKTVTVS